MNTAKMKRKSETVKTTMPDIDDFLILPVCGVVIHRDFKPLFVDDKFAQLYGLGSAEEAMAVPSLLNYIDEAGREEAIRSYRKIISGLAEPSVRQFRNVDNRGRDKWVLAIAHMVDWQGEPAVHTTLIDMTPRVEAETRLRNSEQKFRDLAELSIQGIIVHRDFKPLFTNMAYANMHGYESPEEILALPSIQVLFSVEDIDDGNTRLSNLMEKRADSHRLRLCNTKRDGSKMWVDLVEHRIQWNGEPAIQTIVVDVTEQHRLEQKIQAQALTDELTGLANRRRLMERFDELVKFSRRYRQPLSCILMDLDRFKSVNDQYGHAVGDEVLRQFAEICRQYTREVDFIGRYGGEEFLILLPETCNETACQVAERLRVYTEQAVVNALDGQPLHFTVSSAVAQLDEKDTSVEQLIQRADKGLYQAKSAGRNRVWCVT